MRTMLPFVLVLLAVFTAACIIYIAWELSSDNSESAKTDGDSDEP